MAKRQNFIVGSTNAVSETLTDAELNTAWNRFEILGAGKLDGVFKAVSDYSNDSSNEIANAIQSLTGAQPSGSSQTELADALQQMRNEIETTSLTFKGYVATSAPSSSTYTLVEGNLWINSATMPTSFPIAASSIKEWNGSSWVNYGSTYTPKDFDFFRNINDNEGYYWFGGLWTVMSTDMSTTYFTLNQSTGKWEIKSSVNLPGSPTTTTPDAADQSTKIATTQFAHDFGQRYVTNCITEIPQDISATITNGSLIMNAGSKVYFPNGSGTFDVFTLPSNFGSGDVSSITADYMFFINNSKTGIAGTPVTNTYSGTTAPASPSTGTIWYDTTNNSVKRWSGSAWVGGFSFPVAILSAGAVLKQVFNGVGYIGSTVFVLPNIKGLNPQGLNADGTLNNNTVTISSVMTKTLTTTATGVTLVVDNNNLQANTLKVFDNTPDVSAATWCYSIKQNKLGVYTPSDQSWTQTGKIIVGTVNATTGGVITSLNQKTAFHAVDYNDFSDLKSTVYTKSEVNTIANGKANLNLLNTANNVDFVIESQEPTSANNYTWYRKYRSGWVEQGQYVNTTNTTITFPVPMANTDYMLVGVGFAIANQGAQQIAAKTTTGFQTASDMHISWTNGYYCCGMAA